MIETIIVVKRDIRLQAVDLQQCGRMYTRCGRVSLDLWNSIRACEALTLLNADNGHVNRRCLHSIGQAVNYGLYLFS